MSAGKNTEFYQALKYKRGVFKDTSLELIGEEPLLIRINDKPYSVVMRTPGEEISHGAGFCLSEGIIDSYNDVASIGHCKDDEPNIIDIWIKPEREKKIKDLLSQRGFISQTSCGICGKEMIKDLFQILMPAENGFEVEINQVFDCINKLSENQNYYQTTRGSHAAIIFNDQLQMISFAEDVGRHNALDKAIGKAFMNKKIEKARILVLSSRISYELIQKAARARISIIISNSRPTALAAEMGMSLNMTLAFPVNESELIIVCGKDRIVRQQFT